MAPLAIARVLRVGCWTTAGSGAVASFVFFNCYPYSAAFFSVGYRLRLFGEDILPYVIVARAATLGRTIAPLVVPLVASFSILALGVFTHLDYTKFNFMNGWINDTSLVTVAWKWMAAVLALAVAATCSLWMKFFHVPKLR